MAPYVHVGSFIVILVKFVLLNIYNYQILNKYTHKIYVSWMVFNTSSIVVNVNKGRKRKKQEN